MKSRLFVFLFATVLITGCGGQTYSSRDVAEEVGGNQSQPMAVAEAPADSATGAASPDAPSPSEKQAPAGQQIAAQSATEPPLAKPLPENLSVEEPPPAARHSVQAARTPVEEVPVELPLPQPRMDAEVPSSDIASAPRGNPPVSSLPAEPVVSKSTDPSGEAALAGAENARREIEVSTAAGEPVLQVRYAWRELSRPSVQIARVEESGEPAQPIPLDDQQAEELWRSQVARLNKPVYPSSPELVEHSVTFLDRGNGELITVRGRKNLLGKASAYAVDEQAGSPVICYLLDRWADEQGVLHFALTDFDLTDAFKKPGKLRVWMVSEEQVVWEETVDWPGDSGAPSVAQQSDTPSPEKTEPADPVSPGKTAVTGQPDLGPSSAGGSTPPTLPEMPANGQNADNATDSQPSSPAGSAVQQTPAPTQPSGEPSPGWKPAEVKTPRPDAPPAKRSLNEMSIDELARHIETEFGSKMSPAIRRFWLNGYKRYYIVPNPPEVRRKVLMDMLRSAYAEKPPAEMAEAFRVLFEKLKVQ